MLDHSSLWTTLITCTRDLVDVKAFPRSIMKWSADRIFGPAFQRFKQQSVGKVASYANVVRGTHRNSSDVADAVRQPVVKGRM
jgi:hypothetical protein